MGIPVVIKASGGMPVTVTANGYGTPMDVAANGYGTPVTVVASGGLPVVGISGGAAYAGVGNLATGWIAWYGLRAFSTATAGTPAIRLIRDSGGEQDISTLADGTLNVTAAAAFISGTTGRIAIWYDQTGNGYHINTFIDGAPGAFTLAAIGSRPGIVVVTANWQTSQALLSTYAQPWSASVVAKRTSGGQSSVISAGSQQVLFATAASTVGAYAGGGELATVSGATDGSFHDFSVVANGTSTIICLRGTDTTGLIVEGGGLVAADSIRFPSSVSGSLDGVLLEGGFFAGALTAPQRAAIAANQAAYYGHR